jgi:hypothetical protein
MYTAHGYSSWGQNHTFCQDLGDCAIWVAKQTVFQKVPYLVSMLITCVGAFFYFTAAHERLDFKDL